MPQKLITFSPSPTSIFAYVKTRRTFFILKSFDFFDGKPCSFGYFSNIKAEPFKILCRFECFLTGTVGKALLNSLCNALLYANL